MALPAWATAENFVDDGISTERTAAFQATEAGERAELARRDALRAEYGPRA